MLVIYHSSARQYWNGAGCSTIKIPNSPEGLAMWPTPIGARKSDATSNTDVSDYDHARAARYQRKALSYYSCVSILFKKLSARKTGSPRARFSCKHLRTISRYLLHLLRSNCSCHCIISYRLPTEYGGWKLQQP
jgi:hypothetical protein